MQNATGDRGTAENKQRTRDAGALQVCISANKAGRFTGMSTLRCIQQILLTTVQDEASALLCILLEILQTAEQRKHTGAVNIFLEFTPSGGSSAQSIPFMFGALHSIIVLLCKVNLFLKKNKRLSL